MSAHLIFLFIFQGGLALAFSLFIVRVLMNGLKDQARQRMVRGINKIRLLIIVSSIVFPVIMFVAYFKSLPENQPLALAIWPAVWILVILLALIAGISLGMRGKSDDT